MRHRSANEADRGNSLNPKTGEKRESETAKRLRGERSEEVASQALELLKSQGVIADFRKATRIEDQEEETDFWISLGDGANLRIQVKSSAARFLESEEHSRRDDIHYLVIAHQPANVIAEKIRTYILSPYAFDKVFHALRMLQARGFIGSFSRISRDDSRRYGGGFRFESNRLSFTVRIRSNMQETHESGARTEILDIADIANATFEDLTEKIQEMLRTTTFLR